MKRILQKSKSSVFTKAFALFCFVVTLSLNVNAQIFVQAEDYKSMSGVQTEGTSDAGGGINVGWIDNNDWLEYSVNIPLSGDYAVSVRVASLNGGGVMNVASGANSLGNINIAATGGWQIWKTVTSSNLTFSAGIQTIRLKATTGGFNLNWIEIKLTNPADVTAPTAPEIVKNSAGVHDISLTWKSSKDVGSVVVGYKIFNSDKFLAFTKDTIFSLSKLAPLTAYNLMVYACDLAGNLSSATQLTTSTTAPNWALAWSDEFDGTAVDRTKWNFQTGGGGWGNGEAQYYTDGANATVANGLLTIEARKENFGGNEFTSTRMNTSGKGDFLYGRVEVKAKLPKTGGTWPAIWTLPTDWAYGNWPNSGEIDIMEHTGNGYGTILGTIHTQAYNHSIGTAKGGSTKLDDVTNTFHTYIIEWYPDRIDWYVDDNYFFTFNNENKTPAEWPFDKRMHMLLNVAIGGGLGGTIDKTGVWPQQMTVDYVRIYKFDFGEGDNIAPSNVTNLNAVASGIDIDLTWTASTDNKYVDKYYIFKNDVLIDSTSGCKYKVTNLEALKEYTFAIQAKDFGRNLSGKTTIKATTGDVTSYSVPGIIQAENYLYMSGIQTETCTDAGAGTNVSHISVNDWLEYNIDVKSTGKYILTARVAAQSLKGSFQVLDKDKNVLTTIETPITGAWQTWTSVTSGSFNLNAGKQRLTIKSLAMDYNINWFEISSDNTTSVNDVIRSEAKIYPNPVSGSYLTIQLPDNSTIAQVSIINIDGREIYKNQFYNVQNEIRIENLNLNSGIYIINISNGNHIYNQKLIVR